MFIELSVLTQIRPVSGKGESQTTYVKRLINTDHIIDVMDDPKASDLMHLTLTEGKIVAEGSTKKLKTQLAKLGK